MSQLDILLIVLRVLFAALVPLCFIAVLVWMERRGAAYFQDRSGPNRANVFGFRAGGTAVFHVAQRAERSADDVVAAPTLDIDDERDTACIVFESGVVQT